MIQDVHNLFSDLSLPSSGLCLMTCPFLTCPQTGTFKILQIANGLKPEVRVDTFLENLKKWKQQNCKGSS